MSSTRTNTALLLGLAPLIGLFSCLKSDSSLPEASQLSTPSKPDSIFLEIDSTPPRILATYPSDGDTAVRTCNPIKISFSEPIDSASLTVNTLNNKCTECFRVSADDFQTCVKAARNPSFDVGDSVAYFYPASNFIANARYQMVICNSVADKSGNRLALPFRSDRGFTTSAVNGVWPFALDLSFPSDGALEVPRNTNIILDFNQELDSAGLGGVDSSCVGPLKISEVGKAGCLPFKTEIQPDRPTRLRITPLAAFVPGSRIRLDVSAAIKDIAGDTLQGPVTSLGFSVGTESQIRWTMVNVNATERQGDAHLIRIRGGKTILIDVGTESAADTALIGLLRKQGLSHIDAVYITHAHNDHYGGLVPMINAGIAIDTVYFNVPPQDICDAEIPWGCNYADVLAKIAFLKSNGITVLRAAVGDSADLGQGAVLKILYGFDGDQTPVGKTDINDMSLIISLDAQGHKILFSGDLNEKIGRYLAINAKNLDAEILKVPHHGTSGLAPTAFFDKVAPKIAMVPSPAALWCSDRSKAPREYFAAKQIKTYVNGFSGNVSVEIKDSTLSVQPEFDPVSVCASP